MSEHFHSNQKTEKTPFNVKLSENGDAVTQHLRESCLEGIYKVAEKLSPKHKIELPDSEPAAKELNEVAKYLSDGCKNVEHLLPKVVLFDSSKK